MGEERARGSAAPSTPDGVAVPPGGAEPAGTGERARAVRNVGWSAVQSWFVRLAGVATFVVMGRLLGAGDIGLVALATAVVGFLAVLADFGMSTFLLQARALDRRTTSTVFWATAGLGVVGALAVCLAAGPLAAALGEPRAAPVLRALAVGLVLTTLTCVPAAVLLRGMRFRAMAMRGVAAAVVSAVVGIGLALAGYGVWALVAQNLAQNAFSLVWFWVAAGWRPSATLSRETLRDIGRRGSTLLGIDLVQALRDRADPFLIGGVAGVEVLGYWTIATRVLGLVHEVTMSVMDHVALPVFVRVRDDRDRLVRAYEAATAASSALLAPGLAVLAVVTPLVVPGLFGPQWEPAVLPAQIMCLAYAVGGVGYFTRAVLLAVGRAGVAWGLAVLTLTLHAGVVLLAGRHGLATLAWAFCAEVLLGVLVSAVALRAVTGVPLAAHGRALRALLAAGLTLAPMLWVREALDLPDLVDAVVAGAVGAGLYALLMLVLNRRLVGEVVADVGSLLPGRAAGRVRSPRPA